MRIPTSVIVMSLLTAAPFGMAIRDTLKKKQPADAMDALESYDQRASRRDREALEEYEREMARVAEERAKAREKALAAMDDVFGSTPASMGSLLDGLVLGADAGNFQPEATRKRIDQAARDGFVSVSFGVDQIALRSVTVDVVDGEYGETDYNDPCDHLRNKLNKAWGPANNGTWLDATKKQRAHLDHTYNCELTFAQFLDASDWVAALPIDLIGKNGDKYFEKVWAEVDDDGAVWTIPGTGAGTKPTQMLAFIEKGKVIGLSATTNTDFDTLVAVREALSTKLKGQPKLDEDYGDSWQWKTKIPAKLAKGSGGGLELSIGRDPWD